MTMSSPPPPNNNGTHPQLGAAKSTGDSPSSDKFITSDPALFAKKLNALNNENEVLIVLKNAGAARIAKSTLQRMPSSGSIALPNPTTSALNRTKPGFAPVNDQSRQAITSILNARKIAKFKAPDFGNVITAKISKNNAEAVINALLKNPNIDYIEANQSYPVHFDSEPAIHIPNFTSPSVSTMVENPQGSNPSDLKHTFHNVLDAWDYTRGSGAKVGILDSGFSYDQGTGSYHPDGQLLSTTIGIEKKGFVDDYDQFGGCGDNSADQPYGNCVPWDDNYSSNGPDAHGTAMAGLVGENDNNKGYVGVMPRGLTVSMKVAQNCHITKGCANDSFLYEIESDDFYWAIQWARNNDIDVLSMSFTGPAFSSTIYNSLYDAYSQDDILLVAATGNSTSDLSYPRHYAFVMGIGGLDDNNSTYGVDEDEEVSALSGGRTLLANCATDLSFCDPNGYQNFYPPFGGTSSSTAITAGIAGLVRAYEPSLTAPQVRQRLIDTSTGFNHKVNALRAVTNNIPLTVSISGPSYIGSSGTYTWQAVTDGGNEGYSYQWQYRESLSAPWQNVSTNQQYSRFVSTNGQRFYLKIIVTSGSEQASSTRFVNVSSGDCPPNQICPE